MTGPDPFSCAVFLIIALVLAGILQTAWIKLPSSGRFAIALDGGLTFQGRRLLGDHKTVRGFMVMVPATGATFLLLAQLLKASSLAIADGIWQLSVVQYFLLGLGAGLGFMLGELPNSFLKRRLRIPPGGAPGNATARAAFFLLDRLDSIVGMLVAVSLLVPTAWSVWAWVLLIGPAIHWSFSLLFYFLGMKTHPA
jgi:CDP-diglyceride synthetase